MWDTQGGGRAAGRWRGAPTPRCPPRPEGWAPLGAYPTRLPQSLGWVGGVGWVGGAGVGGGAPTSNSFTGNCASLLAASVLSMLGSRLVRTTSNSAVAGLPTCGQGEWAARSQVGTATVVAQLLTRFVPVPAPVPRAHQTHTRPPPPFLPAGTPAAPAPHLHRRHHAILPLGWQAHVLKVLRFAAQRPAHRAGG